MIYPVLNEDEAKERLPIKRAEWPQETRRMRFEEETLRGRSGAVATTGHFAATIHPVELNEKSRI